MLKLQEQILYKTANYVAGSWIQADSGRKLSVINPVDGSLLGQVPACGAAETRRAIEAAAQAWPSWRSLTAGARAEILWRWAYLIDQNKEDLAYLITLEEGKPLAESLSEVDYANSFVKWFAEEGRRIYGDIIPSTLPNQHLLVLKQPIGVVAAITPWNFPAAMITRKCAPALAAGCPVVIKPAEETPFTALALAVLAEKAGLPKGVFNVLTGLADEIGLELTSNSLVRKFSFTGSTAVGKLLMRHCASTVKKVSLELGGNAPFLVFDDADVDAAVKGTIASKFRNMGQSCVCANRIFVQEGIYETYTEKLVAAVTALKVGNGLDEGVQQGPLINEAALKKVNEHVVDAVSKGAKIVCGGKPHALGGLFFEPTVLTEAKLSMRLAQEETFGPVAPLFRFRHEEEGIRLANQTEFGLGGYFYSRDLHRVWRVAEALECGMIGINEGVFSNEVEPFGGYKESGVGREGSKYGIEAFLEIKYLCMG